MKRLIEASPPHLKPILITALNTGMRKQEILNLKWDCVDFKKNIITISVEDSKSKKSRAIPMSNMLRSKLSEIISNTKSIYVFPDPLTNKPYKGIRHHSLQHEKRQMLIADSTISGTISQHMQSKTVLI